MNQDLFSRIKQDLRLFPDEVINDWLLPYAEQIGWPPDESSNSGRWVRILTESLDTWNRAVWRNEKVDLSKISLTPLAQVHFDKMRRAYVCGEVNEYTTLFRDADGQRRHLSAMLHTLQYGVTPKPIILKKVGAGFEIMDGNHRLLAWWSARELNEELKSISREKRDAFFKKINRVWGAQQVVPTIDMQDVWIAKTL